MVPEILQLSGYSRVDLEQVGEFVDEEGQWSGELALDADQMPLAAVRSTRQRSSASWNSALGRALEPLRASTDAHPFETASRLRGKKPPVCTPRQLSPVG